MKRKKEELLALEKQLNTLIFEINFNIILIYYFLCK
jgi:hypothetical protein